MTQQEMENNDNICCGACRFFTNEDAYGWGICHLYGKIVMCDEGCGQGECRNEKTTTDND